jgi:hypothetical protein
MFMMMDDIGALFWRFGKKLLATHAETEQPPAAHKPDRAADHRDPPPAIVHSPAAE